MINVIMKAHTITRRQRMIGLGAVLVLAATGVYWALGSPAPADIVTQPVKVCSSETLRICAELAEPSMELSSQQDVRVTVTNTGKERFSTTFATTCDDPELIIDGKPVLSTMMCGAAITQVEVAAGETRTYYQKLRGTSLTQGNHDIQYRWASATTPKLRVERQ
jgi:hypothetical protein